MKKILFLLLFTMSINTHLYSSQNLVIGSIREKDDTLADFLKNLWQEEKADFTYPKKITLDFQKTKNECLLHIVADATKHSFPPACFSSIYIERLPTLHIYTECIEDISDPIGRVKFPMIRTIFNTKKALADNGRLTIEWFASCSLDNKSIAKMQHTQDELFSDESFPFCKNKLEELFNIENELENIPFHCFINKSLLCITLYNVANENPDQKFSISPEILINGLKNNYAKNKIPGPLKKKFFTFCKERNFSSFDTSITQSEVTQQIIINALCLERNSRLLAPTIRTLLNFYKEKKILEGDNDIEKTITQNLLAFELSNFEASILHLFALDSAIIFLSPYVKKYMEKNGFENCTIERKKSEWNGRENVWIIEATKKASPKITNETIS